MRIFETKGLYWRVEIEGETIGTILSSDGARGVFRAQLGAYPNAQDLGLFSTLGDAEDAIVERWQDAMDQLIEVLRHDPGCIRFSDHQQRCDCSALEAS